MRALLLPFALLAAVGAGAEPYAVGDVLEALAFEDKHAVAHDLDDSVRVVLFSRDMDGGDVLKQSMKEAPDGFLAERGALYVADIARMPSLVARLFAIPSMRRRPYPMLLDRDGSKTARFPSEEGAATLMFLEELRLVRLLFSTSPAEVRGAIGLSPVGGYE